MTPVHAIDRLAPNRAPRPHSEALFPGADAISADSKQNQCLPMGCFAPRRVSTRLRAHRLARRSSLRPQLTGHQREHLSAEEHSVVTDTDSEVALPLNVPRALQGQVLATGSVGTEKPGHTEDRSTGRGVFGSAE